MIRKLLAAFAALTILSPATGAEARTRLVGDLLPGMQKCVDRSLVPTVSGRVSVRRITGRSEYPGAAAYVYVEDRELWLAGAYYRRHRREPGVCDKLLHELGHLYDYERLGARQRRRIKTRVLGWRVGAHWEGVGADGPEEQFAEAYSVAARYRTLPRDWEFREPDGQVAYGLELTDRQMKRLRRILR